MTEPLLNDLYIYAALETAGCKGMPEIVLLVVRAVSFEFFAYKFGTVVKNCCALARVIQKHSPAFWEERNDSIRQFRFGTVYVNQVLFKVDIVPLDVERFGTSATGIKAEQVKVLESFAGYCFQKVGKFFGSQSRTGLADMLRLYEQICDIKRHKAKAEGASESAVV